MKLYVCSNSYDLKTSISGPYFLLSEEGECLASHWCSNKWYAMGDLYTNRPERISEFTKRFGACECLYFGEDGMTKEELLKRNKEFYSK